MTREQIITGFELYVDDMTELSTAEEQALFEKVLSEIYSERPWEFLKTSATGTLSTSVPYVTLPSDFGYLTENTQNSDTTTNYNVPTKAVLIGTSYNPYQIVNYSDRRQYRDQEGYAYIDIPNSRLVFTRQPTVASSYEFDYLKVPTALSTGGSPLMPVRFHPMVYHGMAIDDDMIQRFDKARSYANENRAKYDDYMRQMAYWNAQLLV